MFLRPLRPLVLDEPDDEEIVVVAEASGLVVEQLQSLGRGMGRDRGVPDPAADRCTELRCGPLRIVVAFVRGRKLDDEFLNRPPGALFARFERGSGARRRLLGGSRQKVAAMKVNRRRI